MKTGPNDDDLCTRITCDPRICGGVPIVDGTRIPAYVILGFLAAGTPVGRLLKGYPTLTVHDIRACLAYAARRLERRMVSRSSPPKKRGVTRARSPR
jgi:uncharacterized protein (DUF433 family)